MLALCGHRRTIRVDQEKLEGGKLNSNKEDLSKAIWKRKSIQLEQETKCPHHSSAVRDGILAVNHQRRFCSKIPSGHEIVRVESSASRGRSQQ